MPGKRFFFAGILGGLLAYFLDPARGAARRTRLTSLAGPGLKPLASSTAQVVNSTPKMVRETISTVVTRKGPDNPNPDDRTLKDRIESEIFRDPRFSREHVNILVVDGVVDLHGQLPTQREIDDLLQQVRSIQNVQGIQSYLHLPGTPAPNKAEAIEAS